MAKFTKDQRKFINIQFGSTSSPAVVIRQILKNYKIVGRAKKQFQLVQFTKVNQEFEKKGTIFRKNKSENPTKITPQKVEEVRTFVIEKSCCSVRKSAPQLDIFPTTYWRIVKNSFT